MQYTLRVCPVCRQRPSVHLSPLLFFFFSLLTVPVAAQVTLPSFGVPSSRPTLCNPVQFATSASLTFRQRSCWYGSELISPWAAVRAAFSSGVGQWKNDAYGTGQDADDYAHRFAVYYIRRSARETGELLAGYLNREDPRPRTSGETLARKRVQSALLSVLLNRTGEGDRLAFAPIAGSLGSGFAGAAFNREHSGLPYALRLSAVTYASYFGKAVYREFQPDLTFYVNRMLHRQHN